MVLSWFLSNPSGNGSHPETKISGQMPTLKAKHQAARILLMLAVHSLRLHSIPLRSIPFRLRSFHPLPLYSLVLQPVAFAGIPKICPIFLRQPCAVTPRPAKQKLTPKPPTLLNAPTSPTTTPNNLFL
jgi:hypothetical protein